MPEIEQQGLNKDVLASMGEKFKTAYVQTADAFKTRILDDSTDVDAFLGLAETNVLLYIFGYSSREEAIPAAQEAAQRSATLDPLRSEVSSLSGILRFLGWDWRRAEESFLEALRRDPRNLSARHWYSLYLVAMGRFDEAMAQSDSIMTFDPGENYLVGRGSLLYFQHRFAELKELMEKTIARDPTVPWGYDWLGMAYNGLEEHDDAIRTYYKAFELSDGTAEVGAGLGHALGLAGETALARQISDYYALRAQEQYVPPVQRAFIHIGIGEYEEAIRLLKEAFAENSWFLCFAKVEPWLDPIRNDDRVTDIVRRMGFPE